MQIDLIQIVKELRENSVSLYPTNIDPKIPADVAKLFETFCQLPMNVKLLYSLDPEEDNPKQFDTGYIYRDRKDGSRDSKEMFHYKDGLRDKYRAMGLNLPDSLDQLLSIMEAIYNLSLMMTAKLTEGLDKDFPGFHDQYFPNGLTGLNPGNVIRLILYKAQENQLIAVHHRDRSGITFQLAESKGGMWGGVVPQGIIDGCKGIEDETMRHEYYDPFMSPINKADTLIPVFFGMKGQNMTNGVLKALMHKVVDIDSYVEGYTRWSMIFFAHPIKVSAGSKNDRH